MLVTLPAFRKMLAQWLVTALLASILTACGGSDSSPSTSTATSTSSSSSSTSSGSSSSSATNQSPVISGTPQTTTITGNSYSFTPTASDPNGDTLGFAITNKPSWAAFNTSTGALTGTATAGTYANITISVSDGRGGSASLAAFTITVSASTGSATLTWTKPTLNTDGSTLTDLTGYKVYFGTSPSNLTGNVAVSGSNTLTTIIPGLSTGTTYYFAIASISTSGGEGNKSNPASKTI